VVDMAPALTDVGPSRGVARRRRDARRRDQDRAGVLPIAERARGVRLEAGAARTCSSPRSTAACCSTTRCSSPCASSTRPRLGRGLPARRQGRGVRRRRPAVTMYAALRRRGRSRSWCRSCSVRARPESTVPAPAAAAAARRAGARHPAEGLADAAPHAEEGTAPATGRSNRPAPPGRRAPSSDVATQPSPPSSSPRSTR
jgi:hypothetical protein